MKSSDEAELRLVLGQLKEIVMVHEEMGMDLPPVPRRQGQVSASTAADEPNVPVPPRPGDPLQELREHIGDCTRCKLHKGRTHLVFGEGSPEARLVFVGEGPGHDEDMVGRPFVGKAGEKLTQIIQNGMGLDRRQVYICNVVKCRPPGNRDPEMDEIEACLPFLKKQIEIIRPEVICALGRVAAKALLGDDFKITRDRGKWRTFMGIPLMPIFHPAYILRNPSARRPVWQDVQQIMARLGLEVKKDA